MIVPSRLVVLKIRSSKLPSVTNFRPIIVLSPIFPNFSKQARFSNKLMAYCKDRMLPSQIGLVEGFGCETNIKRLILRTKQIRKKSLLSYSVVFFDFKSAYNTVNRELLYQQLLEKAILTDQEVIWLRSLHSKVTIQSGESMFRPKNGHHQG